MPAFVTRTGTESIVHLSDPDNSLRASLGGSRRSTAMFVNNGETLVISGGLDERVLTAQIEQLLDS